MFHSQVVTNFILPLLFKSLPQVLAATTFPQWCIRVMHFFVSVQIFLVLEVDAGAVATKERGILLIVVLRLQKMFRSWFTIARSCWA